MVMKDFKGVQENFLECITLEEANLVDLNKYTFLGLIESRGVYCFKVRERKR